MISLAAINETYSKMSNEALIHLANTKGICLTDEAVFILRRAYLIRGLDTSVFKRIIRTKSGVEEHHAEEIVLNEYEDSMNSIMNYVDYQKKCGKTNEEVLNLLNTMGLDEIILQSFGVVKYV